MVLIPIYAFFISRNDVQMSPSLKWLSAYSYRGLDDENFWEMDESAHRIARA
jgi:hypothetical protein